MADQRQLQLVLKLQNEASRELKKISGDLGVVGKDAGKASSGFASFAKSIAGVAAAYLSFRKIYDGLSLGLRVAADLETAEVGLTTLLGSAEDAAKTIERLKLEAKRTPFELPGLTQATQLLTSVTKDGDESIDILLDVGEALAAMGKGQAELDRIIVNLQQIAATGRAATIDIRQFAFAGIPIYEMLSEATGKYGEELEELISSGGVTFDLLVEMFDKANDEGGRFFNAFVNQSGTFNQAVSNMKDSIAIFLSDFVKTSGLFDALTNAMIAGSEWLGNYQENMASLRDDIVNFLKVIDENTGLITVLSDTWSILVDIFNEELKPALDELWIALEPYVPYLEAFAQVIGTILLGAIIVIVHAFSGLMIILAKLLTIWTKVQTFLLNVWSATVDKVTDAIAKLIGFVQNLIDKLKSAWEWMQKVASNVGSSLGGAFGGLGNLIPGRAIGGPVAAGVPYVVGERGPELFVPRGDGKIIPNGSLGGGLGMTVNVVVNGDVSGEELVEKVKSAIMFELKKILKLPA